MVTVRFFRLAFVAYRCMERARNCGRGNTDNLGLSRLLTGDTVANVLLTNQLLFAEAFSRINFALYGIGMIANCCSWVCRFSLILLPVHPIRKECRGSGRELLHVRPVTVRPATRLVLPYRCQRQNPGKEVDRRHLPQRSALCLVLLPMLIGSRITGERQNNQHAKHN